MDNQENFKESFDLLSSSDDFFNDVLNKYSIDLVKSGEAPMIANIAYQISSEKEAVERCRGKFLATQSGIRSAQTGLLPRCIPALSTAISDWLLKPLKGVNGGEIKSEVRKVCSVLGSDVVSAILLDCLLTNTIIKPNGFSSTKTSIFAELQTKIISEYTYVLLKETKRRTKDENAKDKWRRVIKKCEKNMKTTPTLKALRHHTDVIQKAYLQVHDYDFLQNKTIAEFLMMIAVDTVYPIGVNGNGVLLFEWCKSRLSSDINKLKSCATADEFRTIKRYHMIRATPSLLTFCDAVQNEMLNYQGDTDIFIAPPVDWGYGGLHGGGTYTKLSHKSNEPLIKNIYRKPDMAKSYIKGEHIIPNEIYDAVNSLQKVAYRVNNDVLDTVEYLFNSSNPYFAEMSDVCLSDAFELMPESMHEQIKLYNLQRLIGVDAVESYRIPNDVYDTLDGKAKAIWRESLLEWRNEIRANMSKLQLVKSQLQKARHFCEFPKIYFTFSIDYRGRYYAVCSSSLQPQGNSLAKALLNFAVGKPLGETGELYLAMQGANTYDCKVNGIALSKLTLHERLAWVEENEEMILSIAENPIGEIKSWYNCDDPFGFLAFCFEWAKYCASGKSKNFVSTLCIALDASANGTQIYSALALDSVGAKSTNVLPTHRPSDLYQLVADEAKIKLEKLFTADEDELNELINSYKLRSQFTKDNDVILDRLQRWRKSGVISRKLTKYPVMTNLYGVSLFGASQQILGLINNGKIPINDLSHIENSVNLMTRIIFKAIESIIPSAIYIQDYLKDCAKVIADAGLSIKWTTPLGMTITQSYRKLDLGLKRLYFGAKIVRFRCASKSYKGLDKKAEKQGFSPNYIHSLDATLMTLVINEGITNEITSQQMIHDSFGTVAGDAQKLLDIIRHNFKNMYHETNLLEDLMTEWLNNPDYKNLKFPKIEKYLINGVRGNLNVADILNSEFFCS